MIDVVVGSASWNVKRTRESPQLAAGGWRSRFRKVSVSSVSPPKSPESPLDDEDEEELPLFCVVKME